MKVSRIILIIILFIAFFEIGIFSSYTIVTSEVPDIQELIDMQINTITSIFSPENVGSVLIKDPNELNVTNKYELADALSEKAQVDGVNLDNFTVTTADDINEGNFTVEITAYGYASPKSSSTTIVISGEPNYKIIAKARAVNGVNGIMVDLDSIEIESILKLQNTDDSNSLSMGNNTSSYSGYKSNSYSSSSSSYSSSSSSGSSGSSSGSASSTDSSSSSSGGSSGSGGSSSSGGSSGSGGSSSSGGSSGSGLEITMDLLRPLFALN